MRPNSSTRRGSGPKFILFGVIQRIPALRNLMSSNAILQFDFTNATTKYLFINSYKTIRDMWGTTCFCDIRNSLQLKKLVIN